MYNIDLDFVSVSIIICNILSPHQCETTVSVRPSFCTSGLLAVWITWYPNVFTCSQMLEGVLGIKTLAVNQ